jgi:hypothetical protein
MQEEEEEEEGLLIESPVEEKVQVYQERREFEQRDREGFVERNNDYDRRAGYDRVRYNERYSRERHSRPPPVEHGIGDRNSFRGPVEHDRYPPSGYPPRDAGYPRDLGYPPPIDAGYRQRDAGYLPRDLGYSRDAGYSQRDRFPPHFRDKRPLPPSEGYSQRPDPSYPPRDRMQPPPDHFGARERYPPSRPLSGHDQPRNSFRPREEYIERREPSRYTEEAGPLFDHQEEHRYSSSKRPAEGHDRKYAVETRIPERHEPNKVDRFNESIPVERYQQPQVSSRSSFEVVSTRREFDSKIRKTTSQPTIQPERPQSPLDPLQVEINRLRQEEFQGTLDLLKLGFDVKRATRTVDNLEGLLGNIEAEIDDLNKLIA